MHSVLLMDMLEKKIVKIIESFYGKAINDQTRKEMKFQVELAINLFCDSVSKEAPKPTILFSFERDAKKQNKLHLNVEFLHPEDNQEISLSEWQDEYETGVTQ